MSEAPLRSELHDGILTLTLDRADKRNALNAAMIDALRAALERAELDAEVRVVAVRGAGPDFCAGADLAELLESRHRTPAENEADAMRLGDVFARMRALPKPVAAIVHGRALAGGAGLATACDLVLASASAQFGYPEIRRGFVPAMVMTMLRRLAGEKAALELVLTGRVVSAEEARALGLVSRIVPDDELDQTASLVLGEMSRGSASALALSKRLFYELDGLSFPEGIAQGARVNALARATPDFAAAIARFLER